MEITEEIRESFRKHWQKMTKLNAPCRVKSIIRYNIRSGKMPKEFGLILDQMKKVRLTLKKARQRFNSDYKLKSYIHERDGFKCIWCGSKSYLEIDHIKEIRFYPDLAKVRSNLRLLCRNCHRRRRKHGKII